MTEGLDAAIAALQIETPHLATYRTRPHAYDDGTVDGELRVLVTPDDPEKLNWWQALWGFEVAQLALAKVVKARWWVQGGVMLFEDADAARADPKKHYKQFMGQRRVSGYWNKGKNALRKAFEAVTVIGDRAERRHGLRPRGMLIRLHWSADGKLRRSNVKFNR